MEYLPGSGYFFKKGMRYDNQEFYYEIDNQKIYGISLNIFTNPSENYEEDLDNYYLLSGEAGGDTKVSEPVSITSSDPSIVSVAYKKMEGDNYDSAEHWYAKPVSAGKTTIVVTCGSQSLSIPVTVDLIDDSGSSEE